MNEIPMLHLYVQTDMKDGSVAVTAACVFNDDKDGHLILEKMAKICLDNGPHCRVFKLKSRSLNILSGEDYLWRVGDEIKR